MLCMLCIARQECDLDIYADLFQGQMLLQNLSAVPSPAGFLFREQQLQVCVAFRTLLKVKGMVGLSRFSVAVNCVLFPWQFDLHIVPSDIQGYSANYIKCLLMKMIILHAVM